MSRPLMACLALLLVACASTPPSETPTAEHQHAAALGQAEQAWSAHDAARARDLLRRVDPALLPPAERFRHKLLHAEIEADHGNLQPAIALALPSGTQLTGDLALRYHTLRARAFDAQVIPTDAARERILLEPLLGDPLARLDNQRAIIASLDRLTPAALERLAANSEATLAGWMELAVAFKTASADRDRLTRELATWRRLHPDHPAEERKLAGFEPVTPPTPPVAVVETPTTAPATSATEVQPHIAVFLPQQGSFAALARPVSDGLLIAMLERPLRERTPLVFHDSEPPENLAATLDQVVNQGAQAAIGPLSREGVDALAARDTLPIPVLALNRATTETTPAGLYQFPLAPEDEAAAIALRMIADGVGRAVALVPEGGWGQRVREAFGETLAQNGGTFLDARSWPTGKRDYSGLVRAVLVPHITPPRKDTPAAPPRSDPPAQNDVQAVFLAARRAEAQIIRPLIAFHGGGRLPVYALSQLHVPRATAERDLDGIVVSEIPWLLGEGDTPERRLVEHLWPGSEGLETRLFALGLDAVTLLPELDAGAGLYTALPLRTGRLRVTPNGRIQREPAFARIEGSRLIPLP